MEKLVELPDKTTVSTDVAATLRKEDLPRTVDGLKKALLKELPNRLKDKDVADLKVPTGEGEGKRAIRQDVHAARRGARKFPVPRGRVVRATQSEQCPVVFVRV